MEQEPTPREEVAVPHVRPRAQPPEPVWVLEEEEEAEEEVVARGPAALTQQRPSHTPLRATWTRFAQRAQP